MSENLLEVEDLTVQYDTQNGPLTAVSEASFTVSEGEYFGLVGESGCGKSTIAEALIGILDPNGRILSGKIRYKGEEIQDFSQRDLDKEIRWKEISMIPQSSMNNLDPLQRISEQAIEIGKTHTDLQKEEILERFGDLFETVGLQRNRMSDYPHQFSGGMQQRAVIALALFLRPSLIVADEPTTALDVIMQDQIFKYLDRIKTEFSNSMILITHDVSLVFESCDSMAVMHAGQLAESGDVAAVDDATRHPYSILLQRAFPDIRHPNREISTIDGTPPQSFGEIDECTFVDRCPWAVEECSQYAPPLDPVGSGENGDHKAACFRKNEVYELVDDAEITNPPVDGGDQ